mgnify:CR=1 FL=1
MRISEETQSFKGTKIPAEAQDSAGKQRGHKEARKRQTSGMEASGRWERQNSGAGATGRQGRKGRAALGAAVFLVLFILLNRLASFFLEPWQGSSEEMWRGFRQAGQSDGRLDTVYVGSSQCIAGVDPSVIDSLLGIRSYNMGTNMQSFHNSLLAARAAMDEKQVRRVVLVLDDELLLTERYDNFRADASFEKARERTAASARGKLEAAADFVFSPAFAGRPASLNYFFPWTYNRSTAIRQNVEEKLRGRILSQEGRRDANGHVPSGEVMTPDAHYVTVEDAAQWDAANQLTELTLLAENRKELEALAALCRERGVELVAVCAPYPNYLTVYTAESYAAMQTTLRELFGAYGFAYYNCNLAKPEFYRSELSHYQDNGHLNSDGAAAFSAFLAKLMEGGGVSEAGENMFYTLRADGDGVRLR